MIGYLNLLLRLIIWFLLTANFSITNIIIGVVIALALPHHHRATGTLRDWLRAFAEVAIAIPQAYMEAFQMIFRPHNQEVIVHERVKAGRSPGLIFLDIFLITFTPKTIVLNYREDGWYDVHRVEEKKSA